MLGDKHPADLAAMCVVDAKDGGTGGVRFVNSDDDSRIFGSEIARAEYEDSDGVPVSITVNNDDHGKLFEIDFWKVNFEPLKTYPKIQQIKRIFNHSDKT